MKLVKKKHVILCLSLILFSIRATSAEPVIGFSGIFAPENWAIGSNPSSQNLVNTGGAPGSIILSNYYKWYSSGSGFSYSKTHPAGVVSFSYSLNGVTPDACPATYNVGSSVKILPIGESTASFSVDKDQSFGFALNGNNTPNDFACLSRSNQTISFTVSNFKFTPLTPSGNIAVGEPYQGGIIAYLYQSGDPGYDPNVKKGFVVSSVDVSSGESWGSVKSTQGVFPCANAQASALGDGKTNTDNIIAANASATGPYANNYAAKTASVYTSGGYSDWILPSKDELNKIYDNRGAIGGSFTASNGWYWSSTEFTCSAGGSNPYPEISSYAYGRNFQTGADTSQDKRAFKKSANAVRAIRYFSAQ